MSDKYGDLGSAVAITGGAVLDPVTGRFEARDIVVRNGVIVDEVPGAGVEVVDASGTYVSPGWVDIHVHVYGEIGIADPDSVGVKAGVTTIADAGSAGPLCYDDFVAVTDDAVTDIASFVYLQDQGAAQIAGIPTAPHELRGVRVGELVALAQAHPGTIKGLKADALADYGIEWVDIAIATASLMGGRACFHLGNFPTNRDAGEDYVRGFFDRVRPGDIVTHMYTGAPGALASVSDKTLDRIRAAQDQGAVLDVGYAHTGFSIDTARRLMAADVMPDTISTDLQIRNARRRAKSLASVASRFFVLGFDLAEIVPRITTAPASVLGLDRYGLEPGCRADLTCFVVDDGEFEFTDGTGATFTGDRMLRPVWAMKDGVRHECDVDAVAAPENLRFGDLLGQPAAAGDRPGEFGEAEADALEAMARAVLVAPLDGATLQLTANQIVTSTEADRGRFLRAIYRSVAGRTSGPQLGWLLAGLVDRHGAETVARHLRDLARSHSQESQADPGSPDL